MGSAPESGSRSREGKEVKSWEETVKDAIEAGRESGMKRVVLIARMGELSPGRSAWMPYMCLAGGWHHVILASKPERNRRLR